VNRSSESRVVAHRGNAAGQGPGSADPAPKARHPIVVRLRCSRLVCALAAAALASSAAAQTYKWTDENGTTNYGAKPPANARNVQQLDDTKSRVSTVPGLKPEAIQAEKDQATQRKIDGLERDLEAQRRETAAAQSRAATDAQWRERCLADRRVDCDDPSRGTFDYGLEPSGYPYYPRPVPRPPRPVTLPARPAPR